VPFNQAGLPGFNVIKDFDGYDERTRHTNADYSERMSEDELKESAIFMATFAWQAAAATRRSRAASEEVRRETASADPRLVRPASFASWLSTFPQDVRLVWRGAPRRDPRLQLSFNALCARPIVHFDAPECRDVLHDERLAGRLGLTRRGQAQRP
jgi:hypothetical protein